jgi:hypothetical protein
MAFLKRGALPFKRRKKQNKKMDSAFFTRIPKFPGFSSLSLGVFHRKLLIYEDITVQT